jgi:flagellar motor protein MotB
MMKVARINPAAVAGFARTPRARKLLWWILGIVAAVGVVGFLVVPPIAKSYLVEALSKALKREVTIESLRFNPYTLAVTVRGLVVKDRAGPEPAFTFYELYVNASLGSLFRLAPVLDQIRLTKPHLRIVRNADRSYNFQDLIDEALAQPQPQPQPKSEGPPPKFALYNIEVADGRIDFDDRPEKNQHAVADLRIGIPFLSTIPTHAEIKVQPLLAAKVNGAPFQLTGESKPFKDTRETTLRIDLDALQLPKYFDYSPVPLKFRLPSGQLDTRLVLAFATVQDKPESLTLAGDMALTKIAVQDPAGAPILSLPALRVAIGSLDAIGRKADVKSVEIQGVEAHLARLKSGELNVMKLVPEAPPAAPKAADAAPPPAPFAFTVGEVRLTDGKLHVLDEVPATPYRVVLQNIAATVQGLSNAPDAKAAVKLGFETDAKGTFAYDGTVQLAPVRAGGKVDLTGWRLGALYPYYESALNLEVADGTLDAATRFEIAIDGDRFDGRLSEVAAALRSLRLHFPGEKEPLWRLPLLEVKDGAVDLGKRSVVLGEVSAREGVGKIVRDADGQLEFARLVKTTPATGRPATVKPGGAAEGGDWTLLAKRARLERFTVRFEDRATATPVRVEVSALDALGEDMSNARGAKGKVAIRGTVNKTGRFAVAGPLATNPVAGRLNVELGTIDLVPLVPYVEQALNLGLTGGAVSAKGVLDLDVPAGAQPKIGYAGDVNVTDLSTVDKPAGQDLLKWKSLYVGGIKSTLEPLKVEVGEIALAEFYSRLIVNADGTLNLQGLVRTPGAASDGKPAEAQAPAKPAADAQPAAAPPSGEKPAAGTEAKIAEAARAAAPPPNISIGKITLQGGNINFSDFFVRPNYSANLTGVGGTVTAITPEQPGEVTLRGKVDNTAPLEIDGRINPLARDLFLDIKASATDIELPPLSPYSVKYAGYGIERGKLSVKVKYLVENRKLAAENNVYLDQLTFGEKVESPTATKLPVLLAVALLKDRNGVIDINLPVGGSLDDPQFSVGGIIIQVIVNLVVKAVTAPFALLGAMFGGGEELAYLEFPPGSAELDGADEAKLKSVAKALNERPGLKLDVAGRVVPETDREGLKRAAVESQVRAQKVKEVGKGGAAAEAIRIEPGEYPKYLTAAYRDASFPKPRNAIGIARDLPIAEMEKLMLEHAQATDDDLRQLANRRAQAAKDWLVAKGGVPADRVFLVAPKSGSDGIKDKGKPERVDFTLK